MLPQPPSSGRPTGLRHRGHGLACTSSHAVLAVSALRVHRAIALQLAGQCRGGPRSEDQELRGGEVVQAPAPATSFGPTPMASTPHLRWRGGGPIMLHGGAGSRWPRACHSASTSSSWTDPAEAGLLQLCASENDSVGGRGGVPREVATPKP
jgi:hypothetical protein